MRFGAGLVFALAVSFAACSREPAAPSPQPAARVTLTGTVRAAGSLAPIQDVRVQVLEGPNAGRETMTNPAGSFTLPDLIAGTIVLQFTNPSYVDLRRTEAVLRDTTIEVTLERGPLPGFVLSGLITTQWGAPIDDVGVEAVHDGRVAGGGTSNREGRYSIPTLPAQAYVVRAIKWGYVTPQVPLTLAGNTTLDIVLSRVRVEISGTVEEAPPCVGFVDGARVEIVDGPDAGMFASSSSPSGYRLENVNWGTFRLRASKAGYATSEVTMNVDAPGSGSPPAPARLTQFFRLQRSGGC